MKSVTCEVMRARRLVTLLFVIAMLAGTWLLARPYVHGFSFVVRAADMNGRLRRVADLDAVDVDTRELTIETRRGALRARLYSPRDGRYHRAALLTSGLHPSGIDEPRLIRLARQLAADRLAIVTPDIPELARFEITPAITDAIEDAALWLASDTTLAPDRRVAIMGISFSGGLSIVAAGRPSLAGRVAYLFSLGGHDDLTRVLRYLCTGSEPRPVPAVRLASATSENPVFVLPPHDYGVAVILLAIADRVVPAPQVERLRAGVRRYLWASALDGGVDKAHAPAEFDAVRELARTMPQPSGTLLRYVVDRDVVHLGAKLLPLLGSLGIDPALSVARSPKPSAPVFLLHGVADNVVPPVESEYLAESLRGHAPVRLLLSGLISHAEADRPPRATDLAQLAGFWGNVLQR
jgi:dienelactone hydrolase